MLVLGTSTHEFGAATTRVFVDATAKPWHDGYGDGFRIARKPKRRVAMLPQEVIRRKRDGQPLDEHEIAFFVRGIGEGSISKAQIGAFAMAVYLRGMSEGETIALTRHMAHSGRLLDWREFNLPGPVLDKHSTGGVGDKVSLILAPIVAACGGFVPMISGRGLGHTGGTLDKLAAIPGYRTDPDPGLFRRVVREVGCAIIGQTADLAPADRRLYAIRDVTATVESIPLITASILSKKLAAGLQALVMDVKCGSGAFASALDDARALARSIVSIGTGSGLDMAAVITDMDQPLGSSAGHALEIAEVLEFLSGTRRDSRLGEVTVALAGEMLALGGLAADPLEGRSRAAAVLADGRARETFARMVAALGGPKDLADRPDAYLARAPVVRPCLAPRAGFIVRMDTRAIGLAIIRLGGGRRLASDAIDHAVGLDEIRGLGHKLARGEPLALVHASDDSAASEAIAALQKAIEIEDKRPPATPAIRERIVAAGREA
jgi:thymidine phosphorylase